MDEQCFFYKWRVENFHFCWHKTGEHLESPLFCIESSPNISWRLWLYPRGEEDGEYISCYLYRDEGGPEDVDVDFELSISIGEQLVKPPMSFEKIYSFKNFQKEGEKSFALRREIFLHHPCWEERLTLAIGCRIFKLNGDRSKATERFARTTIFAEQISGMEVFEDITDLNPENSKDIKVKTLLETYPLISINLSHFDENLIIKILPKSCEKIKYAVCKIIVVKNWERELPIEHVRHWVGEIKADIWRYDVILPKTGSAQRGQTGSAQRGQTGSAQRGQTGSAQQGQTESAQQDIAINAQEAFFLHYDFAYSPGVEYTNDELNDYGPYLWIGNISSLESACEKVKIEESTGYPTAQDALKLFHASDSFADVTIKTNTSLINAHNAVLRARSSELANMLKDNPESIQLGTYRDEIIWRFLLFLYTDSFEDMQCEIAMDLYKMADKYKVELLKKKCRRFIEINCDVKNICKLMIFAELEKDYPLSTHLQKYVIAHDEEIFKSDEWQIFAEKYWTLAEHCMLLKYQNNLQVL